jgi:formate--tetrahydrofolate ligase
VIVATVRALKMNGGLANSDQVTENADAVKKGVGNLLPQIENVRQFGVPAVVANNNFYTDTDAEQKVIQEAVAEVGTEAIVCTHWADGGAGTEALANKVVEIIDSGAANFAPLYPAEMPLWDKINTIATKIYRADEAIADQSVRNQLKAWEEAGFGNLPVCMAKTQYSFTTDPTRLGAPTNHTVPVREVRLAAGAGFVVAICGDIMTMPGLPKVPSAEAIHLDDNGQIQGLF